MKKVEINEILNYLPHRYPFVLIDRVLDYTVDDCITAIKNVTINELFFAGHFPNNPVMPGVLILESMAQTMGILVFKTMESKGVKRTGREIFYFAGIDKVRFKQPVIPGDQLVMNVKITRQKGGIIKASAVATVCETVVCSADLMIAYKGAE
ncbi:MAG: 3-hydroxyacyl-ACP dehydratase FabZ [Gammaproteobacteria bacterium]|jgi:3-hydroxyacyl-[acyl-carrier-protein] dehydratase|nr:3-hydroxyacyl-ACP dehydratase FabZ [Gammaproteobacteria bacterium]